MGYFDGRGRKKRSDGYSQVKKQPKPSSGGRTSHEVTLQQNLAPGSKVSSSNRVMAQGEPSYSSVVPSVSSPARTGRSRLSKGSSVRARRDGSQPLTDGLQKAISDLKRKYDESPVSELADRAVDAVKDIPKDSPVKALDRQELDGADRDIGTDLFSFARSLAGNRNLDPDKRTVKSFQGKKLVGDPTVGQVARASERGKLRRQPNGRLTTPEVRATRKQVKKATRQLRKAKARSMNRVVSDSLNPDQEKFASVLAKKTSLNPRVTGAWAVAEQGGPPGDEYSARNYHNWLNIGPFMEDANFNQGPVHAANYVADSLKGKPGAISFGAGIPNILPQARGKSDAEQAQIILNSGWGTVQMPLDSVSVIPGNSKQLRKARKKADSVSDRAEKLGLQGVPGFDGEGDGKRRKSRSKLVDFKARQRKGDFAGSQRIVQQVIGSPVTGDKEEDHSAGGDHDPTVGDSYAQDIQLGASNPGENEPVYDDALLAKMTRRIRKMGGDIPDLTMGMGMVETNVQGYRLQIIPDSASNYHGSGPHLHVGAKWTGEDPPPGTRFGGSSSGGTWSTTSYTSQGTFTSTAPPTVADRATRRAERTGESVLSILRELGFKVTTSGVSKAGGSASTASASSSIDLSDLEKKYRYA